MVKIFENNVRGVLCGVCCAAAMCLENVNGMDDEYMKTAKRTCTEATAGSSCDILSDGDNGIAEQVENLARIMKKHTVVLEETGDIVQRFYFAEPYKDTFFTEYADNYHGFSRWSNDAGRFSTESFIARVCESSSPMILNDGRPEFALWFYYVTYWHVCSNWQYDEMCLAIEIVKNLIDVYLQSESNVRLKDLGIVDDLELMLGVLIVSNSF
jgi:hypothetical protein